MQRDEESRPFVIGAPASSFQVGALEEPPRERAWPGSGRPHAGVYWALTALALLVAGAAFLFLLDGAALLAPQAAAVPAWLAALIAAVVLLQILPLLAAYRIGRRSEAHDARRMRFLCEVPMYLGLLGSMLGVCATQITTANLAAPLTYVTSASGIALYLFGRFGIELASPADEE